MNLAQAGEMGRSITLDFDDLSEEKLVATLNELVNNPKYRENAEAVAKRFHDRPMTPQEIVVFWTEYAVRHKGASFFLCAGRDLNFIQFYNVDVYCIMFAIILIIIYANYRVIRAIFRRIFKKQTNKQKIS